MSNNIVMKDWSDKLKDTSWTIPTDDICRAISSLISAIETGYYDAQISYEKMGDQKFTNTSIRKGTFIYQIRCSGKINKMESKERLEKLIDII